MTQAKGRGATAAAVERAAMDLVVEHGYDQVTVDMIAQAAGISQRTFFNYFPTKDDALLGREMPRVDERAARRFILSDGPLLLDALSLVSLPHASAGAPTVDDRIRIAALSPSLMAKQMERMGAIESELREVIGLRLEHEHPEVPPEGREDEAMMVTHLLAGVVRFAGFATRDSSGTMPELIERTRATLARVIADSAPAEAGTAS
ncbi:TetR family transcriptional regulator [Schaalia naturae]|uniref:TetR family transcriptional regulator n=1 Tax=Schaalia naturae TaxID=635203 RepID=A0ABW2SJ62_9ACTO